MICRAIWVGAARRADYSRHNVQIIHLEALNIQEYSMISWLKITNLGDVKIMVTAALAIMAGLAMQRAWRVAFWWALLFAFGMALVVATKIAFVGWGIGIRALDFAGISGHSMRATAVSPVLAYLILQNASPRTRAFGLLVGLMLGVVIGVSRLYLRTHSMSEVVAGCLLGAFVSMSFISVLGSTTKVSLSRPLIAFCLAVLLAFPYTVPVSSQGWIIAISRYLSGNDKPFGRHCWKNDLAESAKVDC